MVKKSKEQPDGHQGENRIVELPEDRLEQLEKDEPQNDPADKPGSKSSALRKPMQDLVPEEVLIIDQDKSEPSKEDWLEDIRQSLVTDEVVVEPKGFFERIRNRLKKTSKNEEKESEAQLQFDALLETHEDMQKVVIEQKQRQKEPLKNKDEEKALQDFFADLEALADIEVEEYVPPNPEPRVDLPVEGQEGGKMRPPKILPKSRVEDEVDFDAIRETALEEYDETKIEIEEPKPQLQDEVRQTIRELKPFERFLVFGAGIFGVFLVLFLLTSGIFWIVNATSKPAPTPTAMVDTTDMIHPTRLTLPGGWSFNLGQGQVVDGEWNPQRAEWLAGTEISRWVALPWSLQLEAVLRTLKPEDKLELTMSNFDVLVFNAYSIQELTMEQLLTSSPKTPGILVVLYNNEETDGKYWVVEARP